MKFKIALFCVIAAVVAFGACQAHKRYHKDHPIQRGPALNDLRAAIVVLDSGIESDHYFEPYLCLDGHRDYTGSGIADYVGHGSAIAKLITYGMNPTKQCLLILKYYAPLGLHNLDNMIKGMEYVKTLNKVKYLNLSGGGDNYSEREEKAIAELLSKGIKVIVAAGNEGHDLSSPNCNYYPACTNINSPNMYVVGNCNKNGVYYSHSNYGGPVKQCRDGNLIKVNNKVMSGTSISTAILTSELIAKDNK